MRAWLASSPAAFWLAGCQCSTASQSLKSPARTRNALALPPSSPGSRSSAGCREERPISIARRSRCLRRPRPLRRGDGRNHARRSGPRGACRSGTLSCARPGSASNSPRMAISGFPEPIVAMKAVGMPATPRSTRNPAASSESDKSADEREFRGIRPQPIPRSSAPAPRKRQRGRGSSDRADHPGRMRAQSSRTMPVGRRKTRLFSWSGVLLKSCGGVKRCGLAWAFRALSRGSYQLRQAFCDPWPM